MLCYNSCKSGDKTRPKGVLVTWRERKAIRDMSSALEFRYWRAREGKSECTVVLSMSSKYGEKRTNVCSKAERTCVLLAIGVFVLPMSSKYRDKKDKCMFKTSF